MTMLRVDSLTFAYPDRPLFDCWSHHFAPGLTWLRGDNGSGKSTLLTLIGGALTPSAGRIACNGFDAVNDAVDYRRHVYWNDTDGIAFDHLKPLEFLEVIAKRVPTFDTTLSGVLVDELGLVPFLERRIDQLSTGSRRKVATIATMAAGTDVVLLDEPLAALDRVSSNAVKARLTTAARQRERTWIVTSHEPLGDGVQCHAVDLPSRG